MNIQEVILEQNSHWQGGGKSQAKPVPREILKEIKPESKFIEVITGVRRSGKSTIFKILIDSLATSKKAKPEQILMLNFDHPAFIAYYNTPEKLDEIVEQAEVLSQAKVKYIFLDEVQNIEKWEKWVKAKYDAETFKKIFITGSNADLLSGEYITRLSGRFFSHINYPFSFSEFLDCRGQKHHREYAKNYSLKYKLIGEFDKYLRLGGFPEVVKTGDEKILASYYETIILKDVIAGNQIRDNLGLKQTAYYLISNVAKLFSYNETGNHLGLHENTVKEYIDYLKQAHLFDDLKKFDTSVKRQNRNLRKIYCVDNGLIHSTGFQFSLNSGRYLENLVFGELKRRYQACYYHRDNRECDFVAGDRNKRGVIKIREAIQVCYEINQNNREREMEGLLEAMEAHGLEQGTVLTHNTADQFQKNNKEIVLMPVWRWLLEKNEV